MSEPTPGSEPHHGAGSGLSGEVSPVEEPIRRRADRHRTPHRHPWLRRGGIAVAAGLVVVLLLSVVAYVKLSGNIDRIDIADALGDRPSPQATTDKNTKLAPMNILVMGSDTRKGILGGENNTDARSDTNLVVHLSADRKSAVVVSIPRDSMVKAPANCRDKNSTVDNGVVKQWNASFMEGGPACTIKTLEGNTGLFINHFMVIDFAGFREMVDALGGVTVCSPEPISDEKAHLELPAGKTKVNGRQALGYVRVRYTVGDGSDLGRINRQQAFMSSLVQEATKSSLLLRPDRLFRFLNAATNAMTADSELDLGKMKDIAESVRRIGMDQIRFVTVPTRPYSQDANRVEWTESADVIWQALREDKPLPGTKPPAGSKPTPKPSPTTSQPLTVSPGVIRVRVTNDSGVSGLARQAAEALQVQGFGVDAYVNGQGEPTKGTIIRYGRGMKEAARTVAAAFPKSQLREDNLVGSTIQVSLGMGAANVVEVPNRLGTAPLPKPTITATAPPTSTETITARAANQDICK